MDDKSFQNIREAEKLRSNISLHESDAEYITLGVVPEENRCFETKINLFEKAKKLNEKKEQFKHIRKLIMNKKKILQYNQEGKKDFNYKTLDSLKTFSMNSLKNSSINLNNIPKHSILLNTDKNFRIKKRLKFENFQKKDPNLTPFQYFELKNFLHKYKLRDKIENNKGYIKKVENIKRNIPEKTKVPKELTLNLNNLPPVNSINSHRSKSTVDNEIHYSLTSRFKVETISDILNKESTMKNMNISKISSYSNRNRNSLDIVISSNRIEIPYNIIPSFDSRNSSIFSSRNIKQNFRVKEISNLSQYYSINSRLKNLILKNQIPS